MLKIYQIFYNSDLFQRGIWQQANGLYPDLPQQMWEKYKENWLKQLRAGDASEVLFIASLYDVEAGTLTVLENTYACIPLKVKRVINPEAKGTQPPETHSYDPEEDLASTDD